MRHNFIYIFLLFSSLAINAQINELGVFVSGSNYIGDVGPTDYISPNKPAFGIIYKWNRSPRHSWRFSYIHGELGSNDLDSDVPGRNLRGNDFENNVDEFSIGLEFNFFDFDLHQLDWAMTPYVSTGINYFIYNENYIVNKTDKLDYRHSQFAIPMIVGLKTRLFQNFILGAEIGARYSFTDNLDGSNPRNNNLRSFQFGNLNSKDWYVFSGITLTYTFGENPCFCAN
ncbi:DUF6089 family protein [Flavobacterium sediminilitoris]|uniref:DUF6089 family protein n=1 Tax=Flavobacterium sediminilitoris TaxID=2024526 RepID=A0ABY4HSZ5_9FLAO|nr:MULTISPECIES: DUF6089 family protein [Flavobacterium]UOX35432.1 DUF6089 family protein [Flavobacterium sediminilitoris]